MGRKALHPRVVDEIRICKADFFYFCERYLVLVDKEGNLIPFLPHAAQRAILEHLNDNPWTFVLKARRIGCTYIIAAWIFWRVMFTPHLQAAYIAHLAEAAQDIFERYHRFYAHLPEWMQDLFPLKRSNIQAIHFDHGGRIRVASAASAKLVGGGYQIVHADEVARVKDVRGMMRSTFSAADGGARIIMTTTALGTNEAWHFWNGTGQFSQSRYFGRLFVGWMLDPTAVVKQGDDGWVPPFEDPPELVEWEADLERRCEGITKRQLAFARKELVKQGGDIDGFDQEFPTDAQRAFILSGRPFFSRVYTDAIGLEPREGLVEWGEPGEWRTYVMGVDTAGGIPGGDYSAAYIIDATDQTNLVEMASLYVRQDVTDFAAACLELARRWDAFVNIERNNHGLVVVQAFKRAHYPHLYRTTVQGKVGDETTHKIGWDTTERSRPAMLIPLQSAINMRKLEPRDPRLQNECNTFVWDDRGRPDHQSGAHSDLVVSAGLAVVAVDQAHHLHAHAKKVLRRPSNPLDQIQWEIAHGEIYSPDKAFGGEVPGSQAPPLSGLGRF